MTITPKTIQEFKEIYKLYTGKDMNDEKARAEAIQLFELVQLVEDYHARKHSDSERADTGNGDG